RELGREPGGWVQLRVHLRLAGGVGRDSVVRGGRSIGGGGDVCGRGTGGRLLPGAGRGERSGTGNLHGGALPLRHRARSATRVPAGKFLDGLAWAVNGAAEAYLKTWDPGTEVMLPPPISGSANMSPSFVNSTASPPSLTRALSRLNSCRVRSPCSYRRQISCIGSAVWRGARESPSHQTSARERAKRSTVITTPKIHPGPSRSGHTDIPLHLVNCRSSDALDRLVSWVSIR